MSVVLKERYEEDALKVHLLGIGGAYGTSKAGVGVAAASVLRPDLLIICLMPVIMAGIVGVKLTV